MNRVLALLAVVAFSPLMLCIAAAVRIASGRPVLYREWRLGRNGCPFRLYKFRTLRHGKEGGPSVAPIGDGRVTGLGRFLRRSHLDELPQLINIVRGDMNFVGPRPAIAEMWSHVPPSLRKRALSFRPGLTSPASLSFLCEDRVLAELPDPLAAYRERIFPAKVAQDAAYFEKRTTLSDWLTLLRTPTAVLLHSNDPACRRRIALVLDEEGTAVPPEQGRGNKVERACRAGEPNP